MGHSYWSAAAFQARQSQRADNNQTAFTYDQFVRQTGVQRVHDLMNPHGVVRESRDSDEHPQSLAIAVIFDVTGSMGGVPVVLQSKLGKLMQTLVQRGYCQHPQILFGAVGDAYCDAVPLQIGQFESGLEMDDDLGRIYLEGGGGGQVHESYDLALYFCARHTAIDCYEKRGKKGYLFTIGDEKPYQFNQRQQIKTHIGDQVGEDIPIEQIEAELQRRYQHFHIIPTNTFHGRELEVHEAWRRLLGERVLLLEDEATVCETIALAIGLCEGVVNELDQALDELVAAGYDRGGARTAAAALAPYAAARPIVVPLAQGALPTTPLAADGRLN